MSLGNGWLMVELTTQPWITYVTWVTTLTLAALQYVVSTNALMTGAMIIWMLSLVVLAHFALENIIMYFVVFPALIWTLSGGLSADWEQDTDTNPVLTLLLLLLIIALFLVQGVLWVVLRSFIQ